MRRSVLSSMAARLGQGVQQMRSEQARHGSELNENLRAEQRRWRTCLADVQAQQGEQQQLLEALEARLEAVEALATRRRWAGAREGLIRWFARARAKRSS